MLLSNPMVNWFSLRWMRAVDSQFETRMSSWIENRQVLIQVTLEAISNVSWIITAGQFKNWFHGRELNRPHVYTSGVCEIKLLSYEWRLVLWRKTIVLSLPIKLSSLLGITLDYVWQWSTASWAPFITSISKQIVLMGEFRGLWCRFSETQVSFYQTLSLRLLISSISKSWRSWSSTVQLRDPIRVTRISIGGTHGV